MCFGHFSVQACQSLTSCVFLLREMITANKILPYLSPVGKFYRNSASRHLFYIWCWTERINCTIVIVTVWRGGRRFDLIFIHDFDVENKYLYLCFLDSRIWHLIFRHRGRSILSMCGRPTWTSETIEMSNIGAQKSSFLRLLTILANCYKLV